MNDIMERSFHSKTQMGGGHGGTSKLLPVLQSFGRTMLWQFGYVDGLFSKYGYGNNLDIEYEKNPKMPIYEDANKEEVEKLVDFIFKTYQLKIVQAEGGDEKTG